MPSKKKKYNARFPAGRIKKIMQTDEEVGKVAQAVPVIISRTLELFVESLLTKSMQITQTRNAKTLTPSHMKQCIQSESRFDFLKDLVKNVPDASAQEDYENNAIFEANLHTLEEPEPINLSTTTEQSTSRTPVIQFAPTGVPEAKRTDFSVSSLLGETHEPKLCVPVAEPTLSSSSAERALPTNVPPLLPLSHNYYSQNTDDNLCIDEDYDN